MDTLANMFSLGRGGRANVITQGGRTDDNTGAQMGLRRNSGGSISNEWDDASAPYRDDHSAPSVSARLGGTGDQTPGEIGAYAYVFALEGGGGIRDGVQQRGGASEGGVNSGGSSPARRSRRR